MQITVHFLAQLKKAAGCDSALVEVNVGDTASRLVKLLAEKHGEPLRPLLVDDRGDPQPSLLVFVSDEQVKPLDMHILRHGDVVTLLTPMAGG